MPTSVGDYTTLSGITNITDAVLDEQLVENLMAFFNWGLLNVGAFFNVKRPSTKSKFHVANDPNFTAGRVWESTTSDFVWETSASLGPILYGYQPAVPSLYVNNSLRTSGFYLNYDEGQIVFDTAQPATSVVEMEYAYRRFHFYDTNADWFQSLVFDPLPGQDFDQLLAQNRVHLPAIIIEVPSDSTFIPYQLGDRSVLENITVLFHVIADDDEDRDKIVYVLKRMYQKTIWLYDTNKVADANKFPLQENGSLSPNPLRYPELVNQFGFRKCIFIGVRPQDITPKLPMFRAIVRATLQILTP